MSIVTFQRNGANFQTYRDIKLLFNAEDLDSEFNNLTKFLNKLIYIANNINEKEFILPLTQEDNFKLIQNVGDGTLKLKLLTNQDLNNLQLPINKLKAYDNSDILICYPNQIPNLLPMENPFNILSYDNSNISNSKAIFNNFDKASIKKNHIKDNTITRDKLPQDFDLFKILPKDYVNSEHIPDKNIDSTLIKVNSLSMEKIDDDLLEARKAKISQIKNYKTGYYFEDNPIFANRHFPDNFIDDTIMMQRTNNTPYFVFTSNNIQGNDISQDLLTGLNQAKSLNPMNYLAPDSVEIRHIARPIYIPANTGGHSVIYTGPRTYIQKRKLSPALIEILNRPRRH